MKYFLIDQLAFIGTRIKIKATYLLTVVLLLSECTNYNDSPRFESLSSEKTGITFSNDLATTADFNIINYLYFYDGGGVSIGDINNDGLPDIYFSCFGMLPGSSAFISYIQLIANFS